MVVGGLFWAERVVNCAVGIVKVSRAFSLPTYFILQQGGREGNVFPSDTLFSPSPVCACPFHAERHTSTK